LQELFRLERDIFNQRLIENSIQVPPESDLYVRFFADKPVPFEPKMKYVWSLSPVVVSTAQSSSEAKASMDAIDDDISMGETMSAGGTLSIPATNKRGAGRPPKTSMHQSIDGAPGVDKKSG
jgi:hypothetical protein